MYVMITAILLGVFYFVGRLDVCHDPGYFISLVGLMYAMIKAILFHW